MRTFQYRSESGGQLFGIDLGPHSGVGPSGVGNAVCKSFVDSSDTVPVAASPCCSIETTCNHVNTLINHGGTDGEGELLGNTPLFWRRYCLQPETTP